MKLAASELATVAIVILIILQDAYFTTLYCALTISMGILGVLLVLSDRHH